MIKFPVKNRFSGKTQFTAEINCAEDEKTPIKLGLAVQWAVENGANLKYAYLGGAYLSGAYLKGAYLGGAYLKGAYLSGAYLKGAYLWGAYLKGANLEYAYLRGADLKSAYLRGADLKSAYLRDANLRGANLSGADLSGANLGGAYLGGANLGYANIRDADLRNADLKSAHGVNEYVKSMHLEEWTITYTAEVMQIGCERHGIEEWRGFGDKRILEMDGKRALKFWRKWKDTIFQIIEMCPAKPTNGSKEKKANAEKQRLRLENGKGTEQ